MPTVLHGKFERNFFYGDIPELIREDTSMTLINTKTALASKGVWGSLIGIAGTVLQALQNSGSIPNVGGAPIALTGVGALLALIGRLVAKKKISGL